MPKKGIGARTVCEVIINAVAWASVAASCIRPTIEPFVIANYIGNIVSMALNAAGIIVVMVGMTLTANRPTARSMFVFDALLSCVCAAGYLLARTHGPSLLSGIVFYLFAGASFSLFIAAWVRYLSLKQATDRSRVALPAIPLSIAFLVLSLCIAWGEVSLVALCTKAFSCIAFLPFTGPETKGRGIPPAKPDYDRTRSKIHGAASLAFGLVAGGLLVACPTIARDESFPIGAAFTSIWPLISLATALIFWAITVLRDISPQTQQRIIPFLMLALLAPPFLVLGLTWVLPIAVAFITLGIPLVLIAQGLGPQTMPHHGGRTGILSGYAGFLIGYALGCFIAGTVFTFVTVETVTGVFVMCVLVYALLCLISVFLPGAENTQGSQADERSIVGIIESAAERVAQEHALTPRETEVLRYLAQGRSVPYVQKELGISEGTAASHIDHIYKKLGIHSRQELLDIVHLHREESG